MNYATFLESKAITIKATGFEVDKELLNEKLFEFQKDIDFWAIKKGKAAIFADCGLGKTPMQLEWGRQVHLHTGGDVLIVAPLAVSMQTKREGEKFGIDVNICRCQKDVKSNDYDELVEEAMDKIDCENEDDLMLQAKATVNQYEWEKVITVNIQPYA